MQFVHTQRSSSQFIMMTTTNTRLCLLILLVGMAISAKHNSDTPKKTRRSKVARSKFIDANYLKDESLRFDVIPNEDFEKHLDNFNLDTVHNIAVNPKDQIEYNFDLTAGNGDYVWITYLIKDEADFEFGIIDRSNNSVLYTNDQSKDFMGKLFFERSEKLKVYFKNRAYGSFVKLMVGFECHDCNANKQLAEKDNVKRTLTTLKSIDSIKSKMVFVSEMYKERQKTFLKKLKSSHSNIFNFTVLEIIMVVVINVYQLCSIRNLMSKRILV